MFSCTGMTPTKEVRLVDSLNNKSYFYKYKNLDSSFYFASQAFEYASFYEQGKAEAYNNLAFHAFIRMDFDQSISYCKQVYDFTQNELELLIADIGLMKVYQRVAMNKEFYDYRNSALRRMKRIREDSSIFTDKHEIVRLNYAFTEFYIVSAIYYYYLQQRQEAILSINDIEINNAFKKDTNQFIYYHYIRGFAGLTEVNIAEQRKLYEFDELYSTWQLASNGGYYYFIGSSLQGLADLMSSKKDYDLFLSKRLNSIQHFGLPIDSLLPLKLGEKALSAFNNYNDFYHIADTYVSISKYLNAHGKYDDALDSLKKALEYVNEHHSRYYHSLNEDFNKLKAYSSTDSLYTEMRWIEHDETKTIPEWISRIREQLSVSYAGLGLKEESDYNRNIYLDILNDTRQDKELESRYAYLEKESNQLSLILFLVIIGVFMVSVLFIFFNRSSKIRNQIYIEKLKKTLALCKDITSYLPMNFELIQTGLNNLFGENRVIIVLSENNEVELKPNSHLSKAETAIVHLLIPYIEWAANNEVANEMLSDEHNQLEKQRYVFEQHIATNKRQNIIKKACLAIVNGITPYIDRILNEVNKLIGKGFINDYNIKHEKYLYINELVTTINEYNDILALWIKMKQGTLSLNIETFSLNDIFLIINKGKRTFEAKQQNLEIEPTDLFIKADKALTLFMINTLAENARKYTQPGGKIKIYARYIDDYVEISVLDNGRGLSSADVNRIIDNKIYNSQEIGIDSDQEIDETLLLNKGSGFGLMNCKGIIEKYRKTNPLFSVCLFGVESSIGKGSRFYFRLPIGVRKVVSILAILFFSTLTTTSCINSSKNYNSQSNTIEKELNAENDSLLSEASEFANLAYFANIDREYTKALKYADSAIILLNKHHVKYSLDSLSSIKLLDDSTPAEINWWNNLFYTDYHIILDIRNEAAVAFLALKQIDEYNYNNEAYTTLYKLQSEDKSLEAYCIQLKRSTTNKTIGIILCLLLIIILFIGYYILSLRKRWINQLHLEQVFEINQKIFASSLKRFSNTKEALQREEDTLKDIPQQLVQESFDSINDLLDIDCLGLAVYNTITKQLFFASNPHKKETPSIVKSCFENQSNQSDSYSLAIPLIVDVGPDHQCIGVLYIERTKTVIHEADYLLAEFIARYMSIVVYNTIVRLVKKYRDIESAYEEAHRASWEDSMLHIQNMVLDNCLSTIKHETIYYPNKIKQIINKLSSNDLSDHEERDNIIAICELIEYYKGIFTILSSCASRQLEEVTFRRSTIFIPDLFAYAHKYFSRTIKKTGLHIDLKLSAIDKYVSGDLIQLQFLIENLINEALSHPNDGQIYIDSVVDKDFIRISFTDTRRKKNIEELNQLFYPNLARMTSTEYGELKGTEYLICKQIIREHDEFAGRRGCRINAEISPLGGFTVYFTLPNKIINR